MAVGGPLFGNASARSSSKTLVEFRAGKMTMNASTKLVSPDKRKGLLSIYQSDDTLMHLTWKDRGTGTLEDDLIIFPDDCEFQAVPACTTGRVFVLKFKTSSKLMFFWMQEPKADKDEELCKKVNDSLNNPPAPGSGRSGGGGSLGGVLPPGLDFNNLGDSDLHNLLNNMSQSQLMQLFGGSLGGGAGGNSMPALASLLGNSGSGRSRQAAGTGRTRAPPAAASDTPSTPASTTAPAAAATPAAAAAAAAANPSIQLSDLQSILSNIQVPPGGESIGAPSGPAVDLSSALTLESLQPILSNPAFLEKVKDFLPSEEKEEGKELSADDLKGTVQSPQFKQAVSMFSMALQSGQLGPLVREFGLGETAGAAADQGDMLAFVKALQKDAGAEEKKDDGPEDMALD